ncbi:hypothetical protein GCM10011514_12550 [Emticicia aquatilis]|uniref:Cytochrome C Planctomycete-type domain-containing protein n=1 Tax=Emticicia aquatilis TaxID=1537369 RepID=A0A916YLT0_9BACT|nr:hypothetical protein GCM10011514_12550 [Emticicia aquatilis]
MFLILLLEVLNKFKKLQINSEIISLTLLVTAISATLASILGYFLSLEGGYNEEILEEHQFQGIGLAIFCWIVWILSTDWLTSKATKAKLFYFPSLIFAFVLMIITGHHGGNLTHGESYLTENIPYPFRSWLGMPDKSDIPKNEIATKIQNPTEAQVYTDIVKPIFKQKCEQCHNATKMKGDLRMDDVKLFIKGGKHGVIFKANDVQGSEFIKRILLPESDDDHMPPKGKTQITEDELTILKWWIEQGASFDKKVSQLSITNEVKPILATFGIGNKSNIVEVKQDKYIVEERILGINVDEVEKSSIDKVKKSGGLVLPLSQNNNYVELTFLNNPKLSDDDASLIAIAPTQTLWLKLSNTQITDKSVEFIAKLPNLTRLHLENTKITDNSIKSISTLQNLEYLNLIGTNISDASIQSLSKLKNLKKLYLWKTKVTEKGVENLKKALPNLVVDLGITQQQMAELEKAKANEVSDDVYKKK